MPFELPGMGGNVGMINLSEMMGKALGKQILKRRKLKVPDAWAKLVDEEAEKRMQVWLLPKEGGEPRQLTDEPLGVESFRFAKSADRLVLLASYDDLASAGVQVRAWLSTDDGATWTGLGGTTTYYLYVDRNVSTGAITYGITTNRPTYVNTSTVVPT